MIIDIHAHTSQHQLWNLHVEMADIDALRRLAKDFNIDKIYLMATYFPLKKSGLINEELLARMAGDSLFGCFGSLDAENNLAAGLSELTDLAQAKLIDGLKLYPGYQNIDLGSEAFWPVYCLAEKFGLPIAIHQGELHHCCPRNKRLSGDFRCQNNRCLLDERGDLSHPNKLEPALAAFPKVNFIACHLANPFFNDLRSLMSRYPNLYTDLSGQFVSASDEDTPDYRKALQFELESFLALDSGPERLMFGTDFPIQSYEDSLSLVEALDLSPAIKKNVLSENAKRVLTEP